jgi:glycosyltransferase involved in cell wall biosynthesis
MHRAGHATHLLHEQNGDMVAAFAAVTSSITMAAVRPLAVRKPVEAVFSIRRLRQVARARRIDVIFTSQLGYVSLLAAVDSLGGPPSVVHIGLALSFASPIYRWAQPRIAACVTPSDPMRVQCLTLGWPADRLRVVPNGVDLERFRPNADRASLRARLGLPQDIPVVAYLGRLVEEKGIFTLLRAASELKRRGTSFHLAMVGLAPAGERGQLEALAVELGLGPEHFSLRDVTCEPEAVLAASDVAVVPSQWPEPFGLAAIEAMACGAVAIVSDAGILPQIIGRENIQCIFRQGDAEQLADRIFAVLGNPELRGSLRATGLERVRAKYSLKEFGRAYEDIFTSVIRKP